MTEATLPEDPQLDSLEKQRRKYDRASLGCIFTTIVLVAMGMSPAAVLTALGAVHFYRKERKQRKLIADYFKHNR